jgi:hypothetical protein
MGVVNLTGDRETDPSRLSESAVSFYYAGHLAKKVEIYLPAQGHLVQFTEVLYIRNLKR